MTTIHPGKRYGSDGVAGEHCWEVDAQLDDVVKVPASWSIRGSVDEYLVEGILRRVDHRGSDVRLDFGGGSIGRALGRA